MQDEPEAPKTRSSMPETGAPDEVGARPARRRSQASTIWAAVEIILARAALATLVVCVVALVNPFQADTWTRDRGHELWQRLEAINYPDHPRPKSMETAPVGSNRIGSGAPIGPARDAITVVYLDEDSARQAGMSYPLVLQDQEMMLDTVAGAVDDYNRTLAASPAIATGVGRPARIAPPRALFVDYLVAQTARDGATKDDLLPPIAFDDVASLRKACDRPKADFKPPERPPSRFRCYLLTVANLTGYTHFDANRRPDGWRDGQSSAYPHCQDNPIAKIACIRAVGGLPVIFAGASQLLPPTPPPMTSASDVGTQALAEVALVAPAGIKASEYLLVSPSRAESRRNDTFSLSPAAALYAAYSAHEGQVGPAEAAPCLDAQAPQRAEDSAPLWRGPLRDLCPKAAYEWGADFDNPLEISWGVGSADDFTKRLERYHRGTFDKYCNAGHERAGAAARGAIGVLEDEVYILQRLANMAVSFLTLDRNRWDCPYVHAISYADVDSPLFNPDDLQAAIGDKIVILAGQFKVGGDWIHSPFQSDLPGAYFHAMALDNLIQSGRAYHKASRTEDESARGDQKPDESIGLPELIETLVICFLIFVFQYVFRVCYNTVVGRFKFHVSKDSLTATKPSTSRDARLPSLPIGDRVKDSSVLVFQGGAAFFIAMTIGCFLLVVAFVAVDYIVVETMIKYGLRNPWLGSVPNIGIVFVVLATSWVELAVECSGPPSDIWRSLLHHTSIEDLTFVVPNKLRTRLPVKPGDKR